jgi:murein DD-endopeptidase MepM/ murein hydrolase activator NlpD
MKETKRQGTEKLLGLWKNLTSGISDKVNRKDNSIDKNESRDMGDSHTPISRLDLTGLNREQAKEAISRIIDERLEEISHIEMTELKIDHRERERQRAKAAERINERRNRRKHQHDHPSETIITEEGVYSDFKNASVFDVIQPETFPYEEALTTPIEGQLSIMDAISAEKDDPRENVSAGEEKTPKSKKHGKKSKLPEISEPVEYIPADYIEAEPEQPAEEKSSGFDFFGLLQYDPDNEGLTREQADEMADVKISTAIDEAVDKVFAAFAKNKEKALHLCGRIKDKTDELLRDKVKPVVSAGKAKVSSRLVPLIEKAENKLQLRHKTAVALAALGKRERQASEKMVRFVDFLDRKNEAFLHILAVIRDKTRRRFDLIRDYAECHKKRLLIEFGIAVAAAAMVTIIIGNMTAYEYIYNGKVLGIVKNQEDVYKTIDIIGDKLSTQYDADITIDKDKDIRFKKIIAFNQELDNKDDILNRLTYMRDMKAKGRGIYLDGSLVAILESDETAREILTEIQNKYVKNDPNIKYNKIGFAENVEIKDVETKLGNIQAKDKALEYLMTGAVEEQIHVVQPGETFSEIAKMYGMKQSELKASNPDVVPEKLSIGQAISLNQIVPLVTVQTTEVAQYKEAIPFEIKYENTANLFKNEQTIKSRGTNGEKDVVAEIVRNNGIEVSRNELSATVLTQPVAQVVLVGTKNPPPLIGTGSFIYPVRGTLSSRFGYRWGRLHSGIDLAAPIGTHIKASDGGKVTFAGYNGSLGYMVAIDHGGGRVTWYGHCSKLFVKKGDKVYQGQHIANVGNTGRSTGPHCHFEVHINGVAKNPLKYL